MRRGIAHLVDVGLNRVLQVEPVQQAGKFLVEVVHLTRAMLCTAIIKIKGLSKTDAGETRDEKITFKESSLSGGTGRYKLAPQVVPQFHLSYDSIFHNIISLQGSLCLPGRLFSLRTHSEGQNLLGFINLE